MVPTTTLVVGNTLQQKVVALDRSSKPFLEQIVEASHIVSIDLDDLEVERSSKSVINYAQVGFGPREEWVLRWLLKRLSADQGQEGSLCLESKAWLLLGILLNRVPTTVAARLLNMYKITAVFERTVHLIKNHIEFEEIDRARSVSRDSENGSLIADSSSATIDFPSRVIEKASKKRKRDRTIQTPSKSSGELGFNAIQLLLCICGAIQQMQGLTVTVMGGAEDFATEHMKAVLKTTQEQAAKVLGGSLMLTCQTLETLGRGWDALKNAGIYTRLLSPVIGLWECRAAAGGNTTGEMSSRAFSAECLVPTVRLLLSFQEHSGTILESEPAVAVLQRMLRTHIVLPARAAFLRQSKATSGGSDDLLRDLLAPLAKIAISETHNFPKHDEPLPTVRSVALLFRIASSAMPRDDPKQRIAENPWLQHLFTSCLKCASLMVADEKLRDTAKAAIDMLKDMLEHAVNSLIKLDSATLEFILNRFSGLSRKYPNDEVNWTLVNLCLKLDANIIVSMSPKGEVDIIRQPNEFLDQLLKRLSATGFKILPSGCEKCKMLLTTVVLPLLEAFVRARDLLGFITVWHQQLEVSQKSKSSIMANGIDPNSIESVWEDDQLLHTVAGLLEPSLVPRQIDQEAEKTCQEMTHKSLKCNYARFYANAIKLDCLIDGVKSDGLSSRFAAMARSTLGSITELIMNTANLRIEHAWRLWRILTTITTYWPSIPHSKEMVAVQGSIAGRALDSIRLGTSPELGGQVAGAIYVCGLYAFRFILALPIISLGEFSQSLDKAAREEAVEILVESMEGCSSKASRSSELNPGVSRIEWDGSRETLVSLEQFLLSCATQLVRSGASLRATNNLLLDRFLGEIYWGACWQTFATRSPSYASAAVARHLAPFHYLWLWEILLHENLLAEERSVNRSLHKVQYANFKAIASWDLPSSSAKNHFAFAITGLLRMPIRGFDREERSQIANTVLSMLSKANLQPLDDVLNNVLACLVIFLKSPSKSMELVMNPLSLWAVTEYLNDANTFWTITNIHELRQLIEFVLLYNIPESIQDHHAKYLLAYYNILSEREANRTSISTNFASMLLTDVSLALLWSNREAVSDVLGGAEPPIADLRKKRFQLLLDASRAITVDQSGVSLSIVLEGLLSYPDLLQSIPAKSQVWGDIIRSLAIAAKSDTDNSLTTTTRYQSENVVVLFQKILDLRPVENEVMSQRFLSGVAVLESLFTSQARSSHITHLVTLFRNLDFDEQGLVFSQILANGQHEPSYESSLHVLGRLLKLQKPLSGQARSTELQLSRVLFALCGRLSQSQTPVSCVLTMTCMDRLLRKMSWVTTQWHIDNVLATITVMTSPSAPQLGTKYAKQIFTGMCRLLGTLLAVHRIKLGGRYHLILPALQGLIHCLFQQYRKEAIDGSQVSMPPWVQGQGTDFEEAHALAYSRILTTICEPSVSAVTRSKNRPRQKLNDETKRARNIAGQHLPYLIMDFCRSQLNGRVMPEVRAGLNPGLYAIFNVMSQEAMRTLNAALDSSSRSIFKVLYEDYRRFGRREGT